MAAIHQFVAGFSGGDAISNEARVMRDIFRDWGYKSDIFSESKRILPQLRSEAVDISLAAAGISSDDIVILHLSIGSVVNDVFKTLSCKKVILYHNVTPSHYFDLINKSTAYSLAQGRKQVKELADTADVVLADSRFNADELVAAGYNKVDVLPLVLDLDKFQDSINLRAIKRFDDGLKNILFVGRCAPNKCIEDLIQAFYYYNKYVEPASRFIHVGSFAGVERYYYLVMAQARELGLENVYFAGSVPQDQLNAYYSISDLFLCMSEHEGFCIPVIESMVHNVPVLAYKSTAVPETMDGAGVLFKEKKYEDVAEMMGQLSSETELRSAVLKSQQQRIARYKNRNLAEELRQLLGPLL
jgi:glycosyltransferase involved in cell wall biosynthesis